MCLIENNQRIFSWFQLIFKEPQNNPNEIVDSRDLPIFKYWPIRAQKVPREDKNVDCKII